MSFQAFASPIPSGGAVTILSVYPKRLSITLRHEGFKTYSIEAAEPGGYSLLTVSDTFQICRGYYDDEQRLVSLPIPAEVVADNLIQAWTGGLIGAQGGRRPGVIKIKGSEPTEAELDLARSMQEDYCRYLIHEADLKHARGEPVTDTHREAAKWMGAEDRPWVKRIDQIRLRKCPACAEEIREEARICRWCHTDLDRYERNLQEKAKQKPHTQPQPQTQI